MWLSAFFVLVKMLNYLPRKYTKLTKMYLCSKILYTVSYTHLMEKNPEDYHRWEIQHNPEYFQRYKDLQRERSWVDQQFKVERPAL